MQFIYTVDPNVDAPVMLIHSHIGEDEIVKDDKGNVIEIVPGVKGAQFAKELHALDAAGKKTISVRINSVGGSVMDGYSICSAILDSKARVDTYCDGMAASIAGVIFLCGRKRVMMDFGILMMHDPYGGENSKVLETMKNSLATIIAGRTGKAIEFIKQLMSKETWLDASEAINMEIIDDVEISGEANKKNLTTARNDAKKYWREAAVIFNKANGNQPDKKNKMDFKKINNALDLHEEASERSTVEAIETLQKTLKTTKDSFAKKEEESTRLSAELVQNKSALEKKQTEYDEMKKKCEATEQELNKMKEDKEKTDKEAKAKSDAIMEEEANKICAKLVVAKKIENKAEEIDKWKARYKADPEFVKEAFKEVLNKTTSAKIPEASNAGKTPDGITVAAKSMQEARARLAKQQN